MAEKYYTISGAAKKKGVTYPTVIKAIKDKKLATPIIANAGLEGVQPVQLITEAQLGAWKYEPHSRLTPDQRIERAATILKMDPAVVKAALAKQGK